MRKLIAGLAFMVMSQPVIAAWTYGEQADPMGRNAAKHATIQSRNQITFGSPYGGPQRATLTLRIHPRYGRNVILDIARGQFNCRVDGCAVLVRMDERPAERFSASEPSDNSSDTIFIRDYQRFLRGVKAAKLLRIEAEFFREGTRIFEFDVAGLNWEDAPKPKITPEQKKRGGI